MAHAEASFLLSVTYIAHIRRGGGVADETDTNTHLDKAASVGLCGGDGKEKERKREIQKKYMEAQRNGGHVWNSKTSSLRRSI